MSVSEIIKFYKNQTVFITGGTGFLGKVLVEKLLRLCEVKKIYLLVRPKKEKSTQERIDDYFNFPCFSRLDVNCKNKIDFLFGNCEVANLGIGKNIEERLIEETNIIIHAAANVKLDQPLRIAANVNLRSTKYIMDMAKSMGRLKAFVYVSTAYSNCPHKDIKEDFYEPPMTYEHLFGILDEFNDDVLDNLTPKLIGEWQNVYVFTKAIAEDLVKSELDNLPIAVFRPAHIISTDFEPISGWVDNVYGLMGISVAAGLGLVRSINIKPSANTPLVPCDYVVNCLLALAWNIGKMNRNEIPIYNFVVSRQNTITWDDCAKYICKYELDYPSDKQIMPCWFTLTESTLWHKIQVFFLQTLLGYVADFVLVRLGKEPMVVKTYQKLDKSLELFNHFALSEWSFQNDNVEHLWEKMGTEDRKLFNFDMNQVDWPSYFRRFVIGLRAYLLKDPLETVPVAQRKMLYLKIALYAFITIFLSLLFLIVKFIYSTIF